MQLHRAARAVPRTRLRGWGGTGSTLDPHEDVDDDDF
jgi:hypothetical protein